MCVCVCLCAAECVIRKGQHSANDRVGGFKVIVPNLEQAERLKLSLLCAGLSSSRFTARQTPHSHGGKTNRSVKNKWKRMFLFASQINGQNSSSGTQQQWLACIPVFCSILSMCSTQDVDFLRDVKAEDSFTLHCVHLEPWHRAESRSDSLSSSKTFLCEGKYWFVPYPAERLLVGLMRRERTNGAVPPFPVQQEGKWDPGWHS